MGVNESVKLSLAQRLEVLLKEILKDGTFIPKMYHGAIFQMVKGFLDRTDESSLREQIKKLRDEVIPFLLDE